MAFLLQVYATHNSCPPHAFHRTIYVFICRDSNCSSINQSSNLCVFRCQLPKVNPYYSSEKPFDPDLDGEVPDPYFDQLKYAKICAACGCKASKKCGKCEQRWYCSREHQILDWQDGHKLACGKPPENDINEKMDTSEKLNELPGKKPRVANNGFLFPEYGMELATDYVPRNEIDSDCDDECEEEEEDDKLAKKFKELKQYEVTTNEISAKDLEGLEETPKDLAFNHFHKALSREPEQIMRYDRGGTPILATDLAPIPSNIPKCELCGAPRSFEFQLTPHLLSLMEVDSVGSSIDWATVLVYTCSMDCAIPDSGYVKEFVFKQDFVLEPSEAAETQNNGVDEA
uniref:MYND-type domain-containing protein n=1 Tax=Acrobeloides nanus TaxID=290746 RepID=A0A914CKE3_9BILA